MNEIESKIMIEENKIKTPTKKSQIENKKEVITSDNLDISIKYAIFNEDNEIEYRFKNKISTNLNDRITITCKKENYDSCNWMHPKGFQIKNSKNFILINSDDDTFK